MASGHHHDDAPDLPRRPIDRLLTPLVVFGRHRLAGGGLLIASALVAITWANSPWAESYHHLLHIPVSLGFGDHQLVKTLHHWINDGLMGVFFFLVGLEIKREVLAGELSTVRRASLPAIAAVGGLAVPALIYFLINPDGAEAAGWGVPMATDIAFALGLLALLGDRVPLGLKVFLTALAIVDDIGAVLVIAVFYTDGVSVVSLLAGLGLWGVAVLANMLQVRNALAYFILGSVIWFAFLQSGVHATIAALLVAFTIPARTRIDGRAFLAQAESALARLRGVGVPQDYEMNTGVQQGVLDRLSRTVEHASAPLSRLEHSLDPLVTFVVLPIFALANAGVTLSGSFTESLSSGVSLGVILGLFLGKQVGITLFAWLAVKLGVADLPAGVRWSQIYGVAVLGGVGFTMSLFVAGLAFTSDALLEQAKLGILVGSAVSSVVGLALLHRASPPPAPAAPGPSS